MMITLLNIGQFLVTGDLYPCEIFLTTFAKTFLEQFLVMRIIEA